MEEFFIVMEKLNISSASSSQEEERQNLIDIFGLADVDHSGKLSIEEFLIAYDIFYNRKSEDKTDEKRVLFRAQRYGRLRSTYISEEYISNGNAKDLKFYVYNQNFPSATTELLEDPLLLEDIVSMIEQDSKKNIKKSDQNIMWWLDICCEKKGAIIVNALLQKIGLPRALESVLEKNHLESAGHGSRLCFGESTMYTHTGRVVKSFNMCVESMWLANVPVVHLTPMWVYDSYFRETLTGLYQRLSPALSYDGTPDEGKNNFINKTVANSINAFCGLGPGLDSCCSSSEEKYRRPSFLLSVPDIQQRGEPSFQMNSLTLHILDMAGTPNCLVTFRAAVDEADIDPSVSGADFDRVSEMGAIGRIITAIRTNTLHQVISAGGISHVGELADSSFALGRLLVHLVHQVSMDSTNKIERWIDAVEQGTTDIATTKQYYHIRSIFNAIKVARRYVFFFEDDANKLLETLGKDDCSTVLGSQFKKVSSLVNGSSSHDFQGTSEWSSRLQLLHNRMEDIKEEYRTKLDEQRNFWGFILALFSVFTFPISFSTAYWGMNFENMPELSVDYFPFAPGVWTMWLVNLCVYTFIFYLLLKYRIVEAAM